MSSLRPSFALIFLFIAACAFGQGADFFNPNPKRRELKAVKMLSNIKVDGVTDEPEWALTPGVRIIQVEFATVLTMENLSVYSAFAPIPQFINLFTIVYQ